MGDTVNALTKLAEELTARVDELEKENATLKATTADMRKQASAEKPPVVSAEVADSTLSLLVKTGALNEDQIGDSRKILMSDPEAAHRVLQRILDAQLQTKTASEDQSELYGGRLAGGSGIQSPEDACLDRMMRILGMN